MFEAALNPWYWGGAVAVSSPIIIHLINRLRYRRIRWAAMEFLLKSQQRNRRKIILQQLLLLLLRCLLVLLVVALVARATWGLGDAGRTAELPSYHFILLDDSLSMQDKVAPDGPDKQTPFQQGADLINNLARKALESQRKHYVTVLRLSETVKPAEQRRPDLGRSYPELEQLIRQGQLPEDEPPGQLLTEDEAQTLRNKLETAECSYLRLSLREGVEEAKRYFQLNQAGKANRYLHIVSDFRRRDWLEGDADKLNQLLARLAHPRGGNVYVRLHDVAYPPRTGDRQQVPAAHPNLGFTSLEADSRIATPNARVRLKATLRNFGDTEKRGLRLTVKIDDQEKVEFDQRVEAIPGGEERTVNFDLLFDFTREEEERKLARVVRKVSLHIDDKDHLPADDVRYAYIELRREIPVLLVDPDNASPNSDSAFIDHALTGTPKTGLKCDRIRPSELRADRDLDQYPVIFLLNITGVGNGMAEIPPEGLAALERYVQEGGSVVFFLGPRVNVDSYNQDFYKAGQGLFPAPLMKQPDASRPGQQFVDAPFTQDEFNPPQGEAIYPTLKLLQKGHRVFKVYEDRPDFFYFYTINRYFKVDPGWEPGENARKILQVRNRLPLEFYRPRTSELIAALNNDRSAVASQLKKHALKIQAAVGNSPEETKRKGTRNGALLEALDELLNDTALTEYFQSDAAGQKLRQKAEDLHRAVDTGDPIILEAEVGTKVKGHVLAFLTPAAPTPVQGRDYSWNNWASLLDPAGFNPYPVMLLELHKYLTEKRAARQMETDRTVGSDLEVRLHKDRYDPRLLLVQWKDGQEVPREEVKDFREVGEEIVTRLKAPPVPGHFVLRLNPPPATKGETEDRPLACNVDSRDEGALGRISAAQLDERLAVGLAKVPELNLNAEKAREFVQAREWFTTDHLADPLMETPKSWSDFWWVLLVFFGLLLVEQWLAMKFSYHLKGGTVSVPVRPARPQAPVAAPVPQEAVTP